MNDILLQKILDLLRDGLAHVGNFFKDLFISDPQDGQIIAYDADSGHWINTDAAAVELDLTNTFEDQAVARLSDSANGISMTSLVCEIDNVTGGTDTVVITQTGINQWDEEWENGLYNNSDGTKQTNSNRIRSKGFIPCEPGMNFYAYYGGGDNSFIFRFCFYDKDKTFLSALNNKTPNEVYTVPAGAYFMTFCNLGADITTYNNDISINYPSTDTQYHAYTGTTHTVTLSASVENGYIDIVSGQGKDTDNDTDITCTPTQIKTTGYDNISCDTGNVSGEYYTKTAESVLALANITEDITATITKNTTDFSDILLKVSQNNKVVSIEIYSASTSAAFNGTFLSGLPKPAMNSKVLLANTTLGEDGIILGTLKTSGELDIITSGAKTFSGLITYVAK